MNANLQRRIQRYGWDKAAEYYESSWQDQLKPAHDLLINKVNATKGEKILDIAAGTGLVSFRLANQIGNSGKLLATDISDEMVNIGNQRCLENALTNVKFERKDAEDLSCETNYYDIATCALGLMYFPDPDVALKEMYNSLKPGGRAVAAVWGSRKNCGWAEIFPIVDERVNTDVCPMFFNLGESQVLKFPFENAGFKNISLDKIKTQLFYSTAEEACDASFIGGPVAMAYARFDDKTKSEARKKYIESIAPYKSENGYKIPGEFVVCIGTK